MKKIRILLLMSLLLITSCGTKIDKVTSSDLYIRKIENLSDDFIMGMDLSSIVSLENSGVKFYDYNNNEEDIFKILKQSGITHIRVRIWNDPYDENGHGYGGGNCDINTALQIAKRAKKHNLKMILDFHYSDFWADPGKQMAPKKWKDLDIETKAQQLYQYTYDCLSLFKKEKIDVAIIQLGNETNNGLSSETIWMNIIYHLMASGSKAIREVYPKALIAVHFANPENTDSYDKYASKLQYYNLDYDLFATSYYPYWHGSLDNLKNVLNNINDKYHKKTMIMETSYAYTDMDTDYFPNTISNESSVIKNYPYSIQGQTNAILDIIETATSIDNCIGICYWEGAWITVGNNYESNKIKWEEYGSGWASSFAASYDPNDAGKYYGGSAVDNQAFFDPNGKALESLKLFELCKKGNIVELKPESIEDTYINIDLNNEIILPDKVNALMNDNSKALVDVVWNKDDINNIDTSKVNKHIIKGKADGLDALCYITIEQFNYIKNYSFEENEHKTAIPDNWQVISNSKINELYVEDKKLDSLHGDKHFHFWSDTNPIEFNLYQDIKDLNSGRYSFSISIMGGDVKDSDIYCYVKVNDEIIAKKQMSITTYNNWDTGQIEFDYDGTSKLQLGIYVRCNGENSGAWGKIDNAILNNIGE